MRQLKPAQIIALSFVLLILFGSFLLTLPVSSAEGRGLDFIDALFTATSAACVTGLVVVDTGRYFSLFGQSVILVLIQLGGLGIMTFSTFFILLLGKRMTIKDNLVIRDVLNQEGVAGIGGLIKYILGLTFLFEGLGALLLFGNFYFFENFNLAHASYSAVFHSISAFCNAGFSIYETSLMGFKSSVFINLVIAGLIIFGGLGFAVIIDLRKFHFWRSDRLRNWKGTSLQTKSVVYTSIALILLGTVLLLLFEYNNTLAGMPFGRKLTASFYQSVTARTAGFNTLAIDKLTSQSLFLLVLLMFIGASPGSTGGGIKTTTFVVLIASVYAMLTSSDDVEILKRRLPRNVVNKALSIVVISVVVLCLFIMILLVTERFAHGRESFLQIVFEMVSAMGTVGLSTGVTPELSYIGRFVVIMAMFIGRIGPITLALAIGQKEKRVNYHYVEEHMMVG